MNSKRTKIIIDIFMTIFLVLSFIRWEASNFVFHAIVGSGCTLFFALHIFVHRKWLKATTKSCFAGKLNKSLKGKYVVNMFLLIVWGASIITGFIAIAPFFSGTYEVILWGRIHGITARIGLALVIIHIFQHLPQIKSYFGIKSQRRDVNAKNAVV